MIDYVILEDEPFAYEEMKRMMSALRPDYRLKAWADSVERAVGGAAGAPDLLMVDIRLSDGLCFDVFERKPVNVPVVFTTAYDEFALRAFRVNSIDYLLKPIKESDLERALVKFETNCLAGPASASYKGLEASYLKHVKKNRFLVSVGDAYMHVETADIAFFYVEDRYVLLHTFAGKRHIVNYTLEQLEEMLDRRDFFRLSRNYIAHIKTVRRVSKYFGSRLVVSFSPPCPHEVIVSRTRVGDCLKWLDGWQ